MGITQDRLINLIEVTREALGKMEGLRQFIERNFEKAEDFALADNSTELFNIIRNIKTASTIATTFDPDLYKKFLEEEIHFKLSQKRNAGAAAAMRRFRTKQRLERQDERFSGEIAQVFSAEESREYVNNTEPAEPPTIDLVSLKQLLIETQKTELQTSDVYTALSKLGIENENDKRMAMNKVADCGLFRFEGSTITINTGWEPELSKDNVCQICNGTGSVPVRPGSSFSDKCKACNGTGQQP